MQISLNFGRVQVTQYSAHNLLVQATDPHTIARLFPKRQIADGKTGEFRHSLVISRKEFAKRVERYIMQELTYSAEGTGA